MLAGRIDWPKAKVLADGITGLDPQTARTVTGRLLPDAAERTTGQLRARLAKLVILADPDAARRRYRQGLKGRRVEHGREDDGTARLTGRWLPAARAAAANSRIQAIADWIKDGGDTRTVDQIRADILLDLLQGRPVPGPDGQLLHHLPGDPDHPGTEDHPDHEINGDLASDDSDRGDGAARATTTPYPRRTPGPSRPATGSGCGGPAGRRSGLHQPVLARSRRPATRRARPTRPRPHPRTGPEPPSRRGPMRARPPMRATPPTRPAGPDRRGPDPVQARPATGRTPRRLPHLRTDQTHPRPRTHRPHHHPARPGRPPRPTRLLGPRHRRNHPRPDRRPHQRPLAHLAHRRPRHRHLARPRPHPPRPHRTPTLPHPTQAAHVRARDRRCRFPSCRRPASRAELDHSIPHTHDGPTHECNLCCLCVRHHILKTAGLWTPWQQRRRHHPLALRPRPHLPHRTRTRRGTLVTEGPPGNSWVRRGAAERGGCRLYRRLAHVSKRQGDEPFQRPAPARHSCHRRGPDWLRQDIDSGVGKADANARPTRWRP